VHRAILHQIAQFFLRRVHKNIPNISVSSEYFILIELKQLRELYLLLLRNFIETVPLRGIKGSMISELLHQIHYFWTPEFNLQARISGPQEFPREIPTF
jgi:hypothetical protein